MKLKEFFETKKIEKIEKGYINKEKEFLYLENIYLKESKMENLKEVKNYCRNGKLIEHGYLKNGKRDGEWRYYTRRTTRKGKKIEDVLIRNYADGILDGSLTLLHRIEGIEKVIEKGTYKDGKRVGEWISYHFYGNIKEKLNYKDGKRDGEYFSYYHDSVLKEKGFYKDDKKHGKFTRCWISGKLREKLNYKDDEKHGQCVEYDTNGEVVYDDVYKKGCRIC